MEGSDVAVNYLPSARVTPETPVPQAKTPPSSRDSDDGPSFGSILSALNPLQYLPVVGTIYRAVTGDTIPEGLRIAGSFVVSALTGGPLGMLLNAAATAAEKITGIDPEAIAHDVAESMGISPETPASVAAAPTSHAASVAPAPARPIPEAGTTAVPAGPLLSGAPAARRQEGFARYAAFALG